MRQIRRNVFETNSSSTHSITMCNANEYDDWKNGKVYFNDSWIYGTSEYQNKSFVTKEEIVDIYNKCNYEDTLDINDPNFEEFVLDHDFYTYEDYWDQKGNYYDMFHKDYTTPSGDEVVAFGYYGYDG